MVNRKLKMAYISPTELVGAFFEGFTLKVEGLPEKDVEIVNVDWSFQRQYFIIIMRHEDFPEVPDGEILPTVPVTITRVTKGEGILQYWRDHDSKADGGKYTTWRDNEPLL